MFECEVCGKPANVHVTKIVDGSRSGHHYCEEHVPPEFNVQTHAGSNIDGMMKSVLTELGTEKYLKMIEKLIAMLDASDMDVNRQAEERRKLQGYAAAANGGQPPDKLG